MQRFRTLLTHISRYPLAIIACYSLPAWLLRLGFFRRYVYMGYDQARDSYIFYNISHGVIPEYGPYALSGGYAMPNYYYRIYSVLNFFNKADPVYQALPFVVLSALSVSLVLAGTWWFFQSLQQPLRLRHRLLILAIPVLGIGLSYNELINTPLIWNPMNLLFWQCGLFGIYLRIRHRRARWRHSEALATWAALGAWAVIAASMHGTFLYAIPIWLIGIIGYHCYKKQWFSLAAVGGALTALFPYLHTDSRYDFKNSLLMLGIGEQPGPQSGLDAHIVHNLWNNLSQFSHKVIFGLDQPSPIWTILLVIILGISLVLMIAGPYKQLRWYAWWLVIYVAMASTFGGERGDSTISWHYQQNIMLWPTVATVVTVTWLLQKSPVPFVRSQRIARVVRSSLACLIIICAGGYALGLRTMLGRQYQAAYAPNHVLMSTYEIEQALARIPVGSTICTPIGYYHTSTFEYLSRIRLNRPNDIFTDNCLSMQTGYIFIPSYHYNFWPPHRAVPTEPGAYRIYLQNAQPFDSTPKYTTYYVSR